MGQVESKGAIVTGAGSNTAKAATLFAYGEATVRCPSPILVAGMGMTSEQMEACGAGPPMRRVGLPEQIAQADRSLASAQFSPVTGHALVVDGGLTAAGQPQSAPSSSAPG